jgi:hypothetical protein
LKIYENSGYLNHADYYIKKYLPENILKSENVKFLRMESFETDFKSIFGEFIDLSAIPESEFRKRKKESEVSNKYYYKFDDRVFMNTSPPKFGSN